MCVVICGCTPAATSLHWSEAVYASATIEADGVHVVANRELIRSLPSQGGGESGQEFRQRVDSWVLDGTNAQFTPGTKVTSFVPGDRWLATRVAGHLWAIRPEGLFQDDTRIAAAPTAVGDLVSFGPGPDGGVALALARADGTVALWSEDGVTMEVPALTSTPSTISRFGSSIELSSGTRFGLAVSSDGALTQVLVGGQVTAFDGGFPVAFSAFSGGERVVLRDYFLPGVVDQFSEAVFDATGKQELGQATGWTDPDQAYRFIIPCFADAFDPLGTVLTLQASADAFTLRAGAQVTTIPAKRPNDASSCTLLVEGTRLHAVWLERGLIQDAPTPHLLHHVIVENGAIIATQEVDVTKELFATQ
jgi:hypothetical protein